MFTKKIWIVFIIHSIGYAWVLQEGEGLGYLQNSSSFIKHFIHFGFLVFFFITGFIAWNNYVEKWVVNIWILFYALVLVMLSSRDIIFIFLKLQLIGEGNVFTGIRAFCTSPLPFGICMLLVKLKNNSQKKIK